jgi:hypothetical protein
LFAESGLQDLVIVEEGRGDKGIATFDNPGFVDESMDPKSMSKVYFFFIEPICLLLLSANY